MAEGHQLKDAYIQMVTSKSKEEKLLEARLVRNLPGILIPFHTMIPSDFYGFNLTECRLSFA